MLLLGARTSAADRPPDATLTGVLTRADHQTYKELPFAVPAGVQRVTVDLDYGGREQRTVVDLGLRDPERFRGWSGGNKRSFTVAAEEATPSYLPGPIRPGTWRVILGVPNIADAVRAPYTVRIWLDRSPFAGFAEAPLRTGPGWYRGDLHTHTGHSDGFCAPAPGKARVPCPVHRTLDAARAAGLDFVAITDHNTTSQAASLRELQPAYPDLLVLAGRETTTFVGHFNVIGPIRETDFQIGGPRAPSVNVSLSQAQAAGGLVIVNHPVSPKGVPCVGCGWTAPNTDWSKVDAVEVVNGGFLKSDPVGAEGPLSGVPFWEARLNEGHRLTAIAASDNHDATTPATAVQSVGRPRTVVHARELSQTSILEGLQGGRAFVDLTGSPGVELEFTARAGAERAVMGGGLTARAGTTVVFEARLKGLDGRIEAVVDGRPAAATIVEGADGGRRFSLPADGRRGWVRVNVRDAAGKLLLIGNPIYLNWPQAPRRGAARG
jgi:hypothetical protein